MLKIVFHCGLDDFDEIFDEFAVENNLSRFVVENLFDGEENRTKIDAPLEKNPVDGVKFCVSMFRKEKRQSRENFGEKLILISEDFRFDDENAQKIDVEQFLSFVARRSIEKLVENRSRENLVELFGLENLRENSVRVDGRKSFVESFHFPNGIENDFDEIFGDDRILFVRIFDDFGEKKNEIENGADRFGRVEKIRRRIDGNLRRQIEFDGRRSEKVFVEIRGARKKRKQFGQTTFLVFVRRFGAGRIEKEESPRIRHRKRSDDRTSQKLKVFLEIVVKFAERNRRNDARNSVKEENRHRTLNLPMRFGEKVPTIGAETEQKFGEEIFSEIDFVEEKNVSEIVAKVRQVLR